MITGEDTIWQIDREDTMSGMVGESGGGSGGGVDGSGGLHMRAAPFLFLCVP